MTASAAEVATCWARALLASPDATAPPEDTLRLLTRLTDRLRDALAADPFHAGAGYEVGAALFGSHLTGTDTIGATVTCLMGMSEGLGDDPATTKDRLPALLGAVVTGYTAALRACTLEELELQRDRPFDQWPEGREGAPERHGGGVQGGGPAHRRAAGRGLRDGDTRLRAVFNGLDVAVAVCDPAGHVIDANPALIDLVGHRLAYLRSRTLFDLVHRDDAAVLARVVERDLMTGDHCRVRTEVRLVGSGDVAITVRLTLNLLRDAEGRPVFLVASGSRSQAPAEPRVEVGAPAAAAPVT